ncbi:PspC domain-containing protein [uncultured Streptomyces sp.]|uniref:PspC domain-containing protein n=1 Tax=uncultured Streptomyces sp. TaxID=174707 RepID=UPI002633E141|nr:PspC domain-containing protein [uncultured Streptomyces sp.]
MTAFQDAPPGAAPPDAPKPQLRRSPRQKVVAGVCGGLGRYCDVDPVIFRIVLGVLAVAGGTGLIFYGFAWLLLPAEDEEETELRRLLSGRVEGVSLTALVFALVGCGLFLSMLNNGGVLAFASMLALAVVGFAVWTKHRREYPRQSPATPEQGRPAANVTAPVVSPLGTVPPEAKPPPSPAGPSWWRDPIVKDGTTGPSGSGYLWGPPDAAADEGKSSEDLTARVFRDPAGRTPAEKGPRSIGGTLSLLAVVAGAVGVHRSWDSQPLGTSLTIGLAAMLAVLGLGLLIASLFGRTGTGTVLLAVVTALLLAGAAALPKDITTTWGRETWRPASVAAVQPQYEIGTGTARLDLSRIEVPSGSSVATRVEAGAGRIVVVVPPEVTVEVRAEAGFGHVRLPGPDDTGSGDPRKDIDLAPDVRREVTLAPAGGGKPAGTVELHLEVGVGEVEVSRAAS